MAANGNSNTIVSNSSGSIVNHSKTRFVISQIDPLKGIINIRNHSNIMTTFWEGFGLLLIIIFVISIIYVLIKCFIQYGVIEAKSTINTLNHHNSLSKHSTNKKIDL